jgi:hypothetical protein
VFFVELFYANRVIFKCVYLIYLYLFKWQFVCHLLDQIEIDANLIKILVDFFFSNLHICSKLITESVGKSETKIEYADKN